MRPEQKTANKALLFQTEPENMAIIRNFQSSEILTPQEFEVLSLLASSEYNNLSIEQVLLIIRNSTAPYQRVHTLISRLRPKIDSLNIRIEVSGDGFISASAR